MPALDRAFIKAYAESAPRRTARETASPQVALFQHDTLESIAEQSAHEPLASAPEAATHLATAPATKMPLSVAPAAGPAPKLHAHVAPLSSFSVSKQTHEPLRAQLEVDRLLWPDSCTRLQGQMAEAWDHFAERVMARMAEGQKCLALASCRRAEGRTTVTLAAARQFAARGLKVVVVDADFQNPNLARACGISAQTGWDNVVQTDLPLGKALVAAIEDGLTLLPWHGATLPVAQLSASPRTSACFAALRDHYDLVLLDSLPLVGQTTISEFASLAGAIGIDAMYLVHDVRSTTHKQLSVTCAKLERAGLRVAGLIENFVAHVEQGDVAWREETPAPAPNRKLAAYG